MRLALQNHSELPFRSRQTPSELLLLETRLVLNHRSLPLVHRKVTSITHLLARSRARRLSEAFCRLWLMRVFLSPVGKHLASSSQSLASRKEYPGQHRLTAQCPPPRYFFLEGGQVTVPNGTMTVWAFLLGCNASTFGFCSGSWKPSSREPARCVSWHVRHHPCVLVVTHTHTHTHMHTCRHRHRHRH